MSVMRHWLVVNQRGDLVAWVESEARAKAIQGAYPDAKLKIKGPFVPEPPQGAVALLVSLIETDDAGRIWLADEPGPTAGLIADYLDGLGGQ